MLTDTFLSENELIDLTGRKRAQNQIQVLKQNRIPFFINASGKPRVSRESLYSRPKTQSKKETETWAPAIYKT